MGVAIYKRLFYQGHSRVNPATSVAVVYMNIRIFLSRGKYILETTFNRYSRKILLAGKQVFTQL